MFTWEQDKPLKSLSLWNHVFNNVTKGGSFLSLLPFSPHVSLLLLCIIRIWVMVHCELTTVVCKITIKLGKPSNRKEFRSRYILQDFVRKMVAWCSKFEPIQSFIRYGFGRNRLQNVFKLLNWELPFWTFSVFWWVVGDVIITIPWWTSCPTTATRRL